MKFNSKSRPFHILEDMQITRTAKPVRNMANVHIWHCGGCGVVHMSIGKTVLNFTRQEFVGFTEAVVGINYSAWPAKGDSIFDLVDHDAESYLNAVVH